MKHIIRLFYNSLVATSLPLPVNAIDVYFFATYGAYNKTLTVLLATGFDTINALLTFALSAYLIPIIFRSERQKRKLHNIKLKFQKIGGIFIFIASATPLPFTATIYAVSATGYRNKKAFTIYVLIGRFIKYLSFAVLYNYGIVLIEVISFRMVLNAMLNNLNWISLGFVVLGSIFILVRKLLDSKRLSYNRLKGMKVWNVQKSAH